MASTPPPPSSPDDLQFTTAEPGNRVAPAGGAQHCAACGQPINTVYYAVGNQVICPACATQTTEQVQASKTIRVVKATVFGLGAGLVGTIIWFAVRRLAGFEIGLVAIVVGVMVGKAVSAGSAGRGGLGYQLLAVGITYCSIAANYVPDIVEAVIASINEDRAAQVAQPAVDADAAAGNAADKVIAPAADPAAVRPKLGFAASVLAVLLAMVFIFALAMAAPFLAGAENLIGLLIIGFALWEAWRFNARATLPISGPYQLGTRPAL